MMKFLMNFRERLPRLSQKVLLSVILATLALSLFLLGGIALTAVQASTGGQTKSDPPDCRKDAKMCKDKNDDRTKGEFKVISVDGNSIHVRFILPEDQAGKTTTIITTASTKFDPNRAAITAGKTIAAAGILNKNGSITAEFVGIAGLPSAGQAFYGRVTSIQGNTVVIHTDKGDNRTVRLTSDTKFSRADEKTKKESSASRSDLKVGVEVVVKGEQKDGSFVAGVIVILDEK